MEERKKEIPSPFRQGERPTYIGRHESKLRLPASIMEDRKEESGLESVL